jgi:hypothetical protein
LCFAKRKCHGDVIAWMTALARTDVNIVKIQCPDERAV